MNLLLASALASATGTLATLAILLVLVAIVARLPMASALAPQSLMYRFLSKRFVHDPGTTNACLASPDGGTTVYYVDMKNVHRLMLSVGPSIVGGNGITLVRVFVSDDAAGAVNPILVRTSGAIQLDSLDGASNGGADCYRTEIDAQEIAQLRTANSKPDLRYITIEITTSTNTDEAVIDALIEGLFAFADQSATLQN